MSAFRAYPASTVPITNSFQMPTLQAGTFPNGSMVGSCHPRSDLFIPVTDYHAFQPVDRVYETPAFFSNFTLALPTHSPQDNFLDPSLGMDNFSQAPFFVSPTSTTSSPRSRLIQPCVDTSASGVPRVGGGGSFALTTPILPAQPQNGLNTQQDLLPGSRRSSISSGQAPSEAANCRSKASSFLRKGRSGDRYIVCPKKTYQCLFGKCEVTMQKACDIR